MQTTVDSEIDIRLNALEEKVKQLLARDLLSFGDWNERNKVHDEVHRMIVDRLELMQEKIRILEGQGG